MQESSDRGETAMGAGFAVLPLAIDSVYKAFVHPRPFWAFYYDPEAIYFYDGLRLLRGEMPVNVDNPATLVQLLSAAILLPLRRSVFAVDAFRSAAYLVALVLSALGILLLVRTVLRDAPVLLRLAAVWSYLSFPAVLEYNTVWSPDTLYLAVGSVGLAAAWAYFRRRSVRNAALFGAAIGFCIALKFTFLVWIVAMLLAIALLGAWREMAAAVTGCMAGFVVTTLPVVNRYPDMARFLAKLFLHRGAYGSAPEASLPGVSEIAHGVTRFATAFWPWHLWAAAFLFVALVVLMMRGRSIAPERRSELVFILAAIVLPYVAAARQISPRYLIPSGLAAVALIGMVSTTFRWPRVLQFTAFAAVAFILATTWRGNIAAHDARIVNATRLQAAVRWVIGTRGVANPLVVYSWRFPSPSYALRVLAPEDEFLREIERSFPREGDYNPFSRKLRLPADTTDWDFFVIAPEDLAASPAAGAVRVAQVGSYLVMRKR